MPLFPKLPGYEVLQSLGDGPLTEVFAAREIASGASCAVKVLKAEWEGQPTAVKLLQREARVGLRVRHPHLVQVLEAQVTRPPYFLVMELLAGESLRSRLRRDYRLESPLALGILRRTAEALAALHRAGFIHGDIKPDNIRLVSDGWPKLVDLGFAHRPGENAAFREEGYLLGTADYLAPELCAFDCDASPKSDLFSLGVTWYETLAGRLPYPSGSSRETLRRHRFDRPADIRQFVPRLSPRLLTILDSLLAPNPDQRPTAALLVQRLIELEIATLGHRQSA